MTKAIYTTILHAHMSAKADRNEGVTEHDKAVASELTKLVLELARRRNWDTADIQDIYIEGSQGAYMQVGISRETLYIDGEGTYVDLTDMTALYDDITLALPSLTF